MGMSRRQLLGVGAAGSAALLVGTSAVSSSRFRAPRWSHDPFTLGVASGDPTPDGMVLWTRLAPDPFAPDGSGGSGRSPVTVDYQVAEDEAFTRVVRSGEAVATRESAHSVHPEIHGLAPDRWYYYRFRAGSVISPVGRTRTAPAAGARPDRLRFVFASCQAWSDGYYTAYDHIADEDLDLVVHLGDYIYEDAVSGQRTGRWVESHLRPEARDLAGYRLRYALSKVEAPLQRAHARFPWLVTMDDHEVDDNWASGSSGLDLDIDVLPAVFRRRRAAAMRAMYEHQPLRLTQRPSGTRVHLHRRYSHGDLAEITMLDTRQYRTRQASLNGDLTTHRRQRRAADRTILGAAQREWFLDGLAHSDARWQIIGNQVVMGQTDHDPGPAISVSTDAWDGYVAERDTLLATAADRGVRNLVVITGDRHENYAADLRRDYADPDSAVVGSEFTGTSVTSGGDGVDVYDHGRRLLAANPDLKFFNAQRGYVRVEVDRQLWRNDFRVVPYVTRPGAPVLTRATYVVRDGEPGVIEAWRPDRATDSEPELDLDDLAQPSESIR
ncbi:alkaline phosphatase D family protein [Nocardia bovistercoris]|uniref:Alkaline phosphatase D family protein n=1 Tax=Nocardia bovistercoris TaxID=2785916 RepID=A0A931N5D1_9NOCA|nr:alkaline phosphatase D family protein [Nocardia bovistercoris]MBH0779271.1 alkaline phosphatase D family protein [Nocardia bovistercoris]